MNALPVNYQASTEIRRYPRSPNKTNCCHVVTQKVSNCCRAIAQKISSPLWWVVDKCLVAVAQKPLKDFVFFAGSQEFKDETDPNRLEGSRTVLRRFGGQTQILKTGDGVEIETMYLNVKIFKECICYMGGQFKYDILPDGRRQQMLYVFTNSLHDLCKKMRIPLKHCVGRGWYTPLLRPDGPVPLIQEKLPGVTVLTQGNASIFEFDRARIAQTLLSGQHCMVYNLRGTGRSKGTPSEVGSYKDIETVYQYLTDIKGFFNKQITVLGYCLGGGAATKLAKDHPGVNLVIDRSFLSMGDMISVNAVKVINKQLSLEAGKAEKVKRITRSLLGPISNHLIFGYTNVDKLPDVKGRVCVIDASQDNVIPHDTGPRLRDAVCSECTDITLEGGHCDPWDKPTNKAYLSHLHRRRQVRNFGETPKPVQREDGPELDFEILPQVALLGGTALVEDVGFSDFGGYQHLG